MQCKQKLGKCLCIRSYFWGGFSCHVERTYGGGLRYLGWQPQATVRHMSQAIKNKPAPAYLWNAYRSSAKTMWSRSETIPAEPCPNCWPAELGANKWLLFQTIKNYLTPTMSFHIPVSQNRDMGLIARLKCVDGDKAWRKLSGQKEGGFYLTRTDQIVGDRHLTCGHCGSVMTSRLM